MTATRTKRILSIQNVWDGGGSEKALIRMIRQLAADGWDCHVAIGGPPRLAAEYAAAGATVHIVPMERITTSGGWGRWPRYLAAWPVSVVRLTVLAGRLRADVIHTNTLHSWYGWAAAALLRRPHVWHAREIVVQSALALRVERYLTGRFADRVVAISEAVAAQFATPDSAETTARPVPPETAGPGHPATPDSAETTARPVPPETAGQPAATQHHDSAESAGHPVSAETRRQGTRGPSTAARRTDSAESELGGHVVVIFDEPDPAEFHPALAGRFRARVGIPDDAPLVGSVGRIDTWKGVDVFLDAVPAMRAARPDLEVLVAGPPVAGKERYATELEDRAAALGVHWFGPRDDVPELLADLDVYVMASTEPEPFGLGLVEALAAGTPAVATDAGGPGEILTPLPDSAGRLVAIRHPAALAAAVLALLPGRTDPARRSARRPLRQAGAEARFAELFDQVAQRHQR